MLAMELRQKMSDLESKITSTKQTLDQLIQKRNAVDPAMPLDQLERLTTEIRNHEKRLEDLQLLHIAIEKKQRQYEGNRSKGLKLVEEGGAAYERGRAIFVEWAKLQAKARDLVKDLDQVNLTLSTKAKEFEDLTGESMGLTLSMICYQASAFALAETIKPYDPWTYRSETDLKQEGEKLKAEQLKRHEERIKIAEAHAPDCPNCARANRETKMTIARAEGRSDTPGESLYRGHWCFVCAKCGNRLTQAIPETK